MNRYPLNSRTIGSGGESPLSYATAIQNFVLEVAATAYAIRGMRINQNLTLEQTAQTVITRLFKAAQTFALDVSLTTKTYFQKYAEAAQDFVLSTTATARQRIKRYAQAAQTFALTAQFNVRHWIKTYASAVQNFALSQTSKYRGRISFSANQALSLPGSFRTRITRSAKAAVSFVLDGVVTIRTAIGASIAESLILASSIIASDRTSLPANIERTVEIPESSRIVVVPGESYESGV